MSGIIWLIAKAFQFLMELILDIICLVLLIASLPAIHRWPTLLSEGSFSSRWEFRASSAGNFACMLGDFITLPIFLITLFSWRGCHLMGKISRSNTDRFYNFEARGYTWQQFGLYVFADIPSILAFLLTHVTFWRIPFLYSDLYSICKESSRREGKTRIAIFVNLGNGLLDIFLIPFAIILLVSVYRIPIAWDMVGQQTSVPKKKAVVIYQALLVLVDIPFVFLFLLTSLMLFRTRLLWHEFRQIGSQDGAARRASIGWHFLCSFRDILCLPFFFIVLASIYRGVLVVKCLIDNVSRWAPATPDVTVTSALLELPETRGTGIILEVQGTKPAEYVLPAGTTLKLYIRNTESFWPQVSLNFGDAAGTLGAAMLPMTVSKYCDPSGMRQGETAFTLRFDVGSSVKCTTMRKNAAKMNCDAHIHVETGSHASTLFALSLRLSDFKQYVDADLEGGGGRRQMTVVDLATTYSAETREGKPLTSVFWRIVLLQFAMLVVDICGIVCFLLLHLVPHRAYRMYALACAPPTKGKLIQRQHVLLKHETELQSHWTHFGRCIAHLDTVVRNMLTDSGQRQTADNHGGNDYYALKRRYGRAAHHFLQQSRNTHHSKASLLEPQFLLREYIDEMAYAQQQCTISGCDEAAAVFGSLKRQLSEHGYQFYLLLRAQLVRDGEASRIDIVNLFPASVIAKMPAADRTDTSSGRPKAASLFAANGTRSYGAVAADVVRQDTADLDLDSMDAQLQLAAARGTHPTAATSDSATLRMTESAELQAAIEASLADQRRTNAPAAGVTPNEPTAEEDVSDRQFSQAEPTAIVPPPAAVPHRESPPPQQQQQQQELQLPPSASAEPAAACTSVNALLASWADQLNVHHSLLEAAQRRVDTAYDDEPWCGGKEGWSGARSVIFKEVAQVAYDIAAILCFLVVFATGYRTHYIVSTVCRARNRRKACLCGVVEIFLDGVYLIKMGIVFLGIRGIATLPADLFYYMLEFPSFETARQVIDFHLSIVAIDFLSIVFLVFAWDTLAFAAATVVFGAFSPGVLFESALTRWSENDLRRSSMNVCYAGLLLIVASTWLFGVPCFVGYYVAERSAQSAYIVFFVVLAACMLLGIYSAISLRDSRICSLRRGVVKYLQPSAHNASLLVSMLLEFVWLLAIVFSTSRADIFGADWGEGLERASRYVFLLFGETWTRHGIPFGVYFSIVMGIVFFIVSAAPIVCGEMLHWRRNKRINHSPVWTALMQFLGQTLSLLVARNLAALLICDTPTRTMELSFGQMECWTGPTRSLAVFGMILLSYYVPSCLMRNMRYDESICQTLDVVYPQLYKILVNASNLTAICLCTILYSHRTGVCVVMIVSSAWNLFWTCFYPDIFNPDEGAVCSVTSIAGYRKAMNGSLLAISVLMLIRLNDNAGVSYWSLYATAAVLALGVASAVAYRCWLQTQRTVEDDTIDEVREVLLALEAALSAKHAMYLAWGKKRGTWRRNVRAATRSSPLALLTCELECFTLTVFESKTFLLARWSWLSKAASVVSYSDIHGQITLRPEEDADKNLMTLIYCCICCRTVCRNFSDSDSDTEGNGTVHDEGERLRTVLELATALKNSTNSR